MSARFSGRSLRPEAVARDPGPRDRLAEVRVRLCRDHV